MKCMFAVKLFTVMFTPVKDAVQIENPSCTVLFIFAVFSYWCVFIAFFLLALTQLWWLSYFTCSHTASISFYLHLFLWVLICLPTDNLNNALGAIRVLGLELIEDELKPHLNTVLTNIKERSEFICTLFFPACVSFLIGIYCRQWNPPSLRYNTTC